MSPDVLFDFVIVQYINISKSSPSLKNPAEFYLPICQLQTVEVLAPRILLKF